MPAFPPTAGANWLTTPPNVAPVVVANPFTFWPNLDLAGSTILPTTGYLESPEYLFSVPIADPSANTVATFTRRLTVALLSPFTVTQIPPGLYGFTISVAADNIYSLRLLQTTLLGITTVFQPTGANTVVPPDLPWRNVKTYEYLLSAPLADGDTLDIEITAENQALPLGTPVDNNPGMFTWVMQIFLL